MKTKTIFLFTIYHLLFTIYYSFAQELSRSIDVAHAGVVLGVSVSNDGTHFLSCGDDKRAYMWDVATGAKLKIFSHSDKVNAIAFNSNDKFFATVTSSNKLTVYDGKDGKPKRILTETTSSEMLSVAFHPINDNIATGTSNNNVVLWDFNLGKSLFTMKGHTKPVNAVCFSPDGKYLASGSADNTIKIWDVASGELKNTINANSKSVTSLTYSADGVYLASGGTNSAVILWDANSGNEVLKFSDYNGEVKSIAFSADVQYLAAAGSDKKIVIWNVAKKEVAKTFSAHEKEINSIHFCEDGKILVSGCSDGSVKVWEVKNLKIGKHKFAASGAAPKLICSPITLKEVNNNGLLEAGDNASLNFTIKNSGEGQAFGVSVKLALAHNISGLNFEKEKLVGNIDVDKTTTVSIPLNTAQDLENAAGTFTLTITEANGNNPSPLSLSFQTKGASNYSFIMITNHEYASVTGKAEIGAPITMKLKLKNTSKGEAKNLIVHYKFPEHILAVDKLSENIPSLHPDETKTVEVQFYADKSFTGTEFKIAVDIENAGFSNAKDLKLIIKMNENLPIPQEAQITETVAANYSAPTSENTENKPVMRGSGDALKGLNISKAKEMVIGDYYALIIGIDKYQGSWTPLSNAANDAKAVETLLQSKYKFDHFRKLYDVQATRENIIKELEWLVANAKEKDNVFIYYSGHGEFKQELNKGYWVPVDAKTASTSNYISNSDIQTFLGGMKSKHTLLISDACFSGDIFRGNTVSVPFEDSDKYYTEVHGLTSRQAITSGGIEPVMDGGKDGHSVFAYYLLRTLSTNAGKYIDANQLYNQVKVPVINNSEQSPKLNPIKNTGDEGGQFIFIKR